MSSSLAGIAVGSSSGMGDELSSLLSGSGPTTTGSNGRVPGLGDASTSFISTNDTSGLQHFQQQHQRAFTSMQNPIQQLQQQQQQPHRTIYNQHSQSQSQSHRQQPQHQQQQHQQQQQQHRQSSQQQTPFSFTPYADGTAGGGGGTGGGIGGSGSNSGPRPSLNTFSMFPQFSNQHLTLPQSMTGSSSGSHVTNNGNIGTRGGEQAFQQQQQHHHIPQHFQQQQQQQQDLQSAFPSIASLAHSVSGGNGGGGVAGVTSDGGGGGGRGGGGGSSIRARGPSNESLNFTSAFGVSLGQQQQQQQQSRKRSAIDAMGAVSELLHPPRTHQQQHPQHSHQQQHDVVTEQHRHQQQHHGDHSRHNNNSHIQSPYQLNLGGNHDTHHSHHAQYDPQQFLLSPQHHQQHQQHMGGGGGRFNQSQPDPFNRHSQHHQQRMSHGEQSGNPQQHQRRGSHMQQQQQHDFQHPHYQHQHNQEFQHPYRENHSVGADESNVVLSEAQEEANRMEAMKAHHEALKQQLQEQSEAFPLLNEMIIKTMKEWLVEFGFATVFSSTTPGGRVFRANCLFCKRFGPDVGDQPGNLAEGIVADHLKTSKARSGVQRKSVIKHLKHAHPVRWLEYSKLTKLVATRQVYLRVKFEEDEDGNDARVRILGTEAEETIKEAAIAEGRALAKVDEDAKASVAAAEGGDGKAETVGNAKKENNEAKLDEEKNKNEQTDGRVKKKSATEVNADVVDEVQGVVNGTGEAIAVSTTTATTTAITTAEPVQKVEITNEGGVVSTAVKLAAGTIGRIFGKNIAQLGIDASGDPFTESNGCSTTTTATTSTAQNTLPPI